VLHGDVLGERARLSPDKTALVFVPTGERFTYRQLDERARARAAFWIGPLGLRHGDRIGLLAHNRPEYIDCFFAAAKSGVVLVPLGTRFTAHELAHIVRDSGMQALLFDEAFADTVSALRPLVDLDRFVPLGPSPLSSPDPGPRTPDPGLHSDRYGQRGLARIHRLVGEAIGLPVRLPAHVPDGAASQARRQLPGAGEKWLQVRRLDPVLAPELLDEQLRVGVHAQLLHAQHQRPLQRHEQACVLGDVVGSASQVHGVLLLRAIGKRQHDTATGLTGVAAGATVHRRDRRAPRGHGNGGIWSGS
jgi:hypothetical protein